MNRSMRDDGHVRCIPQIYIDRLASEGLRVITASQPARDDLDHSIIRLAEADDLINPAQLLAGAPLQMIDCERSAMVGPPGLEPGTNGL